MSVKDESSFGDLASRQMSRRRMVTLSIGAASAAVFGLSGNAYAAKKTEPKKYEIIYVLNGGTQAKDQRLTLKPDVIYSATKLLAPKRRGYSFTGWYADEDLEKQLEVLQGVKKKSKRTAYAGWKKKTYTYTYVDNDAYGTVRTKSYTVTTATFTHEKPSRKGHAFAGWFLDEEFEEPASNTVSKGSVGSKKLYAKWDLKSEWKTYLAEMIPKVKAKKEAYAAAGESFVFITDPHVKKNALCSLPAIGEIVAKTKINLLFNGGDILDFHASRETAFNRFKQWNAETVYATIYNMRGNHDNNTTGSNYARPERHVTDDELCTLLFPNLLGVDGKCIETIPRESTYVPGLASSAPYSSGVSVMENIGAVSTVRRLKAAKREAVPAGGEEFEMRTFCYVVDNAERKIRHIVLDTGSPSYRVIETAQLEWMQRRILELSAGWTVIIFAHEFFYSKGLHMNGQLIMQALDAVYDRADAIIAGVISGHSHRDFSYITPKGYLAICIACDAYKATVTDELRQSRQAGVHRQAFDVVHIDTAKRQFYFQRIGFGADRIFKY